jgi:hypothetical protein
MSTHKTIRARVWTAAAVAIGAIALMLPAVAGADALVSNPGHEQDCAFFFGGKVYRGAGTQVITDDGKVNLSCHLTLESGTPVQRPTTTQVGLCDVLETPGGKARASCHYEL